MMHIGTMHPSDASYIADFHRQSISSGFISTLPIAFIKRLYIYINTSPFSTVLVSKDEEGRVGGYIAGTISTAGMYKWILGRHAISLGLSALPACLSLPAIKNVIETLWYGFYNKSDSGASAAEGAELLSIVVSPDFRRKNIGRGLVAAFERYLLDKKISSYTVTTHAANAISTSFYRGLGFVEARRFMHHGNEMISFRKTIVS